MSRRFLLGEIFEALGLEKEDPKTLLGWMSNTKNLLESQKQEHATTGEKLWKTIQSTKATGATQNPKTTEVTQNPKISEMKNS